jgi:GT2 family glycosyltransferase
VRIRVDGKFFSLGDERFAFRGVTYGTFREREDGARFPDRDVIKRDLESMAEAGFTVVRTYTPPPDDLLDIAADMGLKVLVGVSFADWRWVVGASPRERRRLTREAVDRVRRVARRLAGDDRVFAISVGNEIPPDVARWFGTAETAGFLAELAATVRAEDPGALVTYNNYPTTEYLPSDAFDFLTMNVFLERPQSFRRYLTRLHNLAGDRPVVLGELGAHAGEGPDGEQWQAEMLDWQLRLTLERGVAGSCVFSWTDEWAVEDTDVDGWQFGLTRADRSPRPALDVAAEWNRRTVADVADRWPSISVVVCAYNAEATIDECLRHATALDYPELEVLVVDDGSTDATAEITRRHPGARLVSIPHGGLSVARNEGWRAARGELVAYLDSDAYPTPEWPYYLALGLDDPAVGGVGGPNVPPRDDGVGAHQVAQSPGGPLHVLVADDRAEHVPGCNMAFYRYILAEVGGFNPIYTSAGDDVDVCWKVLDGGWEIAFHPAALVWHHRRAGARPYFKQQRGYGRAEALVEARHPDRFTPAGTARWRGRIYTTIAPLASQRIYRGAFGTAAYQSVYQAGGHGIDLAHQVGVPLAVLSLLTAPAALLDAWLGLPALLGASMLMALFTVDAARATPPRHLTVSPWRFRTGVAWLHLLQAVARVWGRWSTGAEAYRDLGPPSSLPTPLETRRDGVVVLPADRDRVELVTAIVDRLRRSGLRVAAPTGWEDHDGAFAASWLVGAEVVTGAFPPYYLQVRLRRRPRIARVLAVAVVAALATVVLPALGAVIAVLGLAEAARGWLRSARIVRRSLAQP